MEWYWVLCIMFSLLLLFLLSGMPVAFGFITLNFIVIYFFMGGVPSLLMVVPSAFQILTNFVLVPVALFVLMGMIIMHSGAGWLVIDAMDRWIGRLPGRLSVLSVVAGTIFAALSGVPMGTTAMLGSIFIPEMRRRGYGKMMSLGPVLGGGGLALIIPPSAMVVIVGGLAKISIGRLLVACVIPGLILSCLYITYILYQAIRYPEQAPKYEIKRIAFSERIKSLRYILPLLIVVFLVTGVIFLGVATPTEAAATGAFASFILVATYGKFSWNAFNKTLRGSVHISVMVMMIIIGSVAFSQVLAYTGCTHGLAKLASEAPLPPMVIVILMQLVVLILGLFMDLISISLITIPIFMPVVETLELDMMWFCTMMLVNLGAATITPPFGNLLFTIKGVVPSDISMADIIRSAIPYFFMGLITIGLILTFPGLALWLPGLMK